MSKRPPKTLRITRKLLTDGKRGTTRVMTAVSRLQPSPYTPVDPGLALTTEEAQQRFHRAYAERQLWEQAEGAWEHWRDALAKARTAEARLRELVARAQVIQPQRELDELELRTHLGDLAWSIYGDWRVYDVHHAFQAARAQADMPEPADAWDEALRQVQRETPGEPGA